MKTNKIFRCLSKNRLYTKMLEYILFSIFTIKMPRSLAAILYIIIYLSTIDRLSVLQLTEKLRGLQALGYC